VRPGPRSGLAAQQRRRDEEGDDPGGAALLRRRLAPYRHPARLPVPADAGDPRAARHRGGALVKYVRARAPKGEPEAIVRLQHAIAEIMSTSYATQRPMLRCQHPKAHGCAFGDLIVGDDVPTDLAKGIFAAPAKYEAWVRFSASAIHPKPDYQRDAHGVALT